MILSQSAIKSFQDCKRRYQLEWEDSLSPIHTAPPLLTGAAVHRGLAVHYKGGTLKETLAAAIEEINSRTPYDDLLEEQLDSVKEQILQSKLLLTNYISKYPFKDGVERRDEQEFEFIHPEIHFNNIPLDPDGEHTLEGTADAIVRWKGQLWLFEHKTAKSTGAYYFTKFENDLQISGYIYGISKALKLQVVGAVINVLKKTKTPEYEWDITTRSKGQLMEFIQTALDVAWDIELCKKEDRWTKDRVACYRYGTCPYLSLCAPGADTPELRQEFYRVEDKRKEVT